MNGSKKILISLTFYLCSMTHFAYAAEQPSMTYKNQRGSVLTLIWQDDKKDVGTLSGTFTTAVGNCKTDMNVALPISGFFNGNAIAITVNFPHCKQVVAMVGHLTHRHDKLTTLWLDAMQATDPTHKDWNANITGADDYERVR